MVLKIRELIQSYHHLGSSGDDILLKCIKDKVEGAEHFAEIYNALLKKNYSRRDAVEGALSVAEHLLRLEARGRPAAPVTSVESASMAAIDIAKKTFEDAMFGGPAPKPQPKEPTFEDSLSDHERKCAVCREEALKRWNAKQGVK